MLAIKARVQDGYLVSVSPVDLPEGAELEVIADPIQFSTGEQMTEENWPNTPEDRARLLARMDARDPVAMTDDELAAWARARREDKAWDLAHAAEHDERLQKVWE